ncbi:capZ-interacting protein isoform X2 [Electrophorus electricus]|uniref:capZ-interacting protein isoform X2 n=1 Tax=Electrophorus electricus TaxID=8005 RepID=UPI0015CFD71A|nr:capZ-interacting protein isoform X2 [Electrophorus electricus]
MEETPPVKPSVAEPSGKFKAHAPSLSSSIQRYPELPKPTDRKSREEKPATASPHPAKAKLKNSFLIEKLQASLTLTPTPRLTLPKSPETKLQATPLGISSPCSSLGSALRPPQANEDEVSVSFEQPAEDMTHLPSINKNRVRLSFKRRLPTRQHRKSAGEEPGEGSPSPSHPHRSDQNEDKGEVFSGPPADPCHPDPDCAVQTQDVSGDARGAGVTREGQDAGTAMRGHPDTPSTSDTMEVQQEERLSEDQSPDQSEGVENAGELGGELPASKENRELKEGLSEDRDEVPGAEEKATLAE